MTQSIMLDQVYELPKAHLARGLGENTRNLATFDVTRALGEIEKDKWLAADENGDPVPKSNERSPEILGLYAEIDLEQTPENLERDLEAHEGIRSYELNSQMQSLRLIADEKSAINDIWNSDFCDRLKPQYESDIPIALRDEQTDFFENNCNVTVQYNLDEVMEDIHGAARSVYDLRGLNDERQHQPAHITQESVKQHSKAIEDEVEKLEQYTSGLGLMNRELMNTIDEIKTDYNMASSIIDNQEGL